MLSSTYNLFKSFWKKFNNSYQNIFCIPHIKRKKVFHEIKKLNENSILKYYWVKLVILFLTLINEKLI